MTIAEVLIAAEADAPNKNTRVSVNFLELRDLCARAAQPVTPENATCPLCHHATVRAITYVCAHHAKKAAGIVDSKPAPQEPPR